MSAVGDKLKKIVGTVFPVIGGALGGPFGALAGNMIQKALGVSNEEAALAQIESDPNALLKLRAVNNEFTAKMRELDIQEDTLHAKDRDSARGLAKEKGIWPQIVLSAIFIGGYFYLMFLFFTSDLVNGLSDFAKGQLGILIGVLTGGIAQVMAFWFGSSSGSKRKTEALANGNGK